MRTCILVSVVVIALCEINVRAFGPATAKSKATALPTIDKGTGKFTPPKGVSPSQFYSPVSTLIKAGPVPFLTRITSPGKYEQAVWRYMSEAKEASLPQAQGNMDAFFASPDVWAEQKMLEQSGKREVYDYGAEPPPSRVALALVWGTFVSGLAGRVVWQLIHGNRNLF
eukprot:CAMPEP_0194047570 /NCGR_PEP_ID=MMETSP0009_2-20130614/25048_1 /TAXON_ID=210454 /ORGANISM="Grammatophora oceanica, Strain CCMP 410" /LENGTH=168 /DNA_ID=CAMNT_0038693231 /DNA_START=49 /DNA_END=555 /DNA_ORIENTATION=-